MEILPDFCLRLHMNSNSNGFAYIYFTLGLIFPRFVATDIIATIGTVAILVRECIAMCVMVKFWGVSECESVLCGCMWCVRVLRCAKR
jgi:multisubunit Na+/H+ antiporter MnhG subunit